LKPNMTVHGDAVASVTGYCDMMGWYYGAPQHCQHNPPQHLFLMGIDFWNYPPTMLASHVSLCANNAILCSLMGHAWIWWDRLASFRTRLLEVPVSRQVVYDRL